jgi:hypothetical protein
MGIIVGYFATPVFAAGLVFAWLLRHRAGGFDRAALGVALALVLAGGTWLFLAMRGDPAPTDLLLPAGVATGGLLILGLGTYYVCFLGLRALWRRLAGRGTR